LGSLEEFERFFGVLEPEHHGATCLGSLDPQKTVFNRFNTWSKSGICQQLFVSVGGKLVVNSDAENIIGDKGYDSEPRRDAIKCGNLFPQTSHRYLARMSHFGMPDSYKISCKGVLLGTLRS
jgi:hypothetical protein